jgi:hypothetical protein
LALALEADDGPPAAPGVTRWELDLAIGSTVLEDGRIVAWIAYPACMDTAWPWWAPGPYGRREFSGVY